MPVMIQIRNVPDDLHRALKARAAQAGMSLSEYLLREARRSVERPTLAEWREQVAGLERVELDEPPEVTIRRERDGR
jgi:plasmid stability protein